MRWMLVFFCMPAFVSAAQQNPVKDILYKVILNKKDVRTIRAEVLMRIIDDNNVRVFKGKYTANRQGQVRIDFLDPQGQFVILNEKGFWWAFIKEKKIVQLSGTEAANMMPGKVMKAQSIGPLDIDEFDRDHIVYQGKRSVFPFSMFHKIEVLPSKRSIYYNKRKLHLLITDHTFRVHAFAMTDPQGRVVYRQEYLNYQNGMPTRIRTVVRKKNGASVINNAVYSRIKTNVALPKGHFVLSKGRGMTYISLGSK